MTWGVVVNILKNIVFWGWVGRFFRGLFEKGRVLRESSQFHVIFSSGRWSSGPSVQSSIDDDLIECRTKRGMNGGGRGNDEPVQSCTSKLAYFLRERPRPTAINNAPGSRSAVRFMRPHTHALTHWRTHLKHTVGHFKPAPDPEWVDGGWTSSAEKPLHSRSLHFHNQKQNTRIINNHNN